MKGILRRTLRGGLTRIIRKRARVLAMLVVMSLLAATLPVTSANPRVANRPTQPSVAVQLYRSVAASVSSLGSWMASVISAPKTTPYEPVAAYISPAPPFIDAPTNLTTTAATASSISLSWTAPAGGGVAQYQIERSANVNGPFFFLVNVSSAMTTYTDTMVTNLHSYLYRVRAVTSGGLPSGPSNMALGTTISFQFNELDNQEIKAQHFHDVRTAINLVRAIGNLSAATWTRPNLVGLDVLASDVNELRTALNAALTALSIPVTAYQDPTLLTGASGTWIHSTHIEQLQARSTKGSSTSAGPLDSDSSSARLDPLNDTGGGRENPLSRNFNWNLPLVSLPGRAGLDLNLTLSYNSLVWTKSNSSIWFNTDNGFPGPGFRVGFPVLQQPYFNSQVGKQAYLLIKPDGSRTELRQVASSNFYEASDSSHSLLDASTMILRTTDGTQMSYVLHGGEFKCTQIKDRNGNFITATYNAAGQINTVTDTLNRVLTFNYTTGWLTSITQVWKQHLQSPPTHYWARFEYNETTPIDFNFPGLTVFGAIDNSTIKTLKKVTLPDNSYFDFSYTSWGQVFKITSFAADNTALNYRVYNLPQTGATAHSDCPRFTTRKDWAKYWNGDTDGTMSATEEVTTATFIIPESASWTMPEDPSTTVDGMRAQVTSADGTVHKIYFIGIAGQDTGWRRGLPALIDTFSGGPDAVRRMSTTWTQDDETSTFLLNPRVKETNVRDLENNRTRKEITYQQFDLGNGMSCHLPRDVYEYAANASTKLRSTRTTYNMTATYIGRRILGLVSDRELYEGDVNAIGAPLTSKVGFFYDNENGSTSIVGTDAPVQHDNTNYTASFVSGRGNLSSVRRYNVTNTSEFTTTRSKYNTAGSLVSARDALDHEVTMAYVDSFSDNNNSRNTRAYATTVTDEDGYSYTSKFDFDFGAMTSKRTPLPNVTTNTAGPEQLFAYNSIGRLEQVSNSINSAYTRFVYSTSNSRIDAYGTVQQSMGEAHSFELLDGFGRVVAKAKDLPGSDGLFSATKLIYDVMGRVFKTSNPTETDPTVSIHPSQWNAVGDDETIGWLYIQQTYDWRGRPLVTTNQDGTTKTASYSGCGCAGGEVTTLTDEGTIDPFDNVTPRKRQQKVYTDVLGRTLKTEALNWEGGAVVAATVNTFNARDQITQKREFSGTAPSDPADQSCPSGTCQKSELTYDGYGRVKTSHAPEQQVDSLNPASTDHTTWDYNADDTIQKITDPRGAVSTFSYNNRHDVTNIAYTLVPGVPTTGSSAIASAPTVSYQYDAVGKRKLMNDGMGSVTYTYDQLSRLTSETRFFSNLSGSSTGGNYTLSYEYNLANQVTKITDPYNVQVNYGYDYTGRLSGVTGTGFTTSTFLSNIQYRAWGAPKSVAHKDNRTTETTYDARLRVATYKLLPAVPADNIKLHNQYDYFPDGRLKKLNDLDDHDPSIIGVTDSARWFSRVYSYDNRGRILKARGWNPNGFEHNFPFSQGYSYDSFNNLTSRGGSSYYQSPGFSDTGTYVNNRRTGWTYAADGQATRSSGPGVIRDLIYNCAGQTTQVKETQNANGQFSTYLASYDGDGELAREFLLENPTNTTSYKVRSTVLGEVVTFLNNAGNKTGTTVHLDKQVTTAEVHSGAAGNVGFPTYNDPLHQSIAGDTKIVYDPLGNSVPWQPWPGGPPPNFYPRSSASFGSLGSSFGSRQEVGCSLDGIPMDCNRALRQRNIQSVSVDLRGQGRGILLELGLTLTKEFYYDGPELSEGLFWRFFHNFKDPDFSFEPGEQEIPGTPSYVNSAAIKHCADKLFGITEVGFTYKPETDQISFQGYDATKDTTFARVNPLGDKHPGRIYITPDNSLDTKYLTHYTNAGRKGGIAFGWTRPGFESRPYVANDIGGKDHYQWFVHEIGNALALLTDKYYVSKLDDKGYYTDESIRPTAEQISAAGHDDPGVTFLDCVLQFNVGPK
jgi:YD repeat-containing protein